LEIVKWEIRPKVSGVKTRLKNGLLKADDFLEQNRRYLRPFSFVVYLIILALVLDYLYVLITSISAISVSIGSQNFQLVTGTISAIAAAFSATATFLIRKGNAETRKTMVRPRILVWGSSREERERLMINNLPLSVTQVAKGGIWVENVGVGPAILCTVYFFDKEKGKIPITTMDERYTFRRLGVNQIMHLPSSENPVLEKYIPLPDPNRLGQKIRIQVEYFDVNRVCYQLEPDEEEIDLYSRRLEKQWKAAMPKDKAAS
jgi:hypothetical protein